MKNNITLGLIVGNRGFFPVHLCKTGRQIMMAELKKLNFGIVTLSEKDTQFGSIESVTDARKCAKLFDSKRNEIDGILVTLPNFGDERAIANAIRWSGLNVPVLIHAFPDELENGILKNRRDSFCGKMSACNNLYQYQIPFSLTQLHTVDPTGDSFKKDLMDFAAICRVVRGFKNLHIGALGARPTAFNTVRYSEKILEKYGISVETLDLFELFGWVNKLKDNDKAVQKKLQEIKSYIKVSFIPPEALMKMAKFGTTVDRWMKEKELKATAVQCWTAMEEFFGIVPCTCMSMMSNSLLPSACETDIMGTVAMYTMAMASGKPSALVDWNNNYGDDPNKGVVFHCSNLPKDVFRSDKEEKPKMDYQEIIAGTVGKDNTYGTVYGRVKASPFTYLRASTDDFTGKLKAYVGEGKMTDDKAKTFGGYGVFEVPNLQKLLKYICDNGFEHHVAINLTSYGDAVYEALTKYLGWEVYHHKGN